MKIKSTFLLSAALLLLAGGASFLQAQQPPPQPPQGAPPAPNTQEQRRAFSIFVDGDSFLGVYPEEINRENMSRYNLQREPRGVGVREVTANSPAARAGLKADDVIVRFNGEDVTSVRKLNRLISEVAPDHTVRLTIDRNGREQELSVTLSKRDNQTFAFNNPSAMNEMRRRIETIRERMSNQNNFTFAFGANRRIGASTTQLTKQLATYFGASGGGLLITSVNENSPAAKAGLKAGDIIMQVDAERIERTSDLWRAINRKNDGEISLTIIRDKSQRTVKLTPERNRPAGLPSPDGQSIGNFKIEMPNIDIQVPMPQIRIEVPQVNVKPFRFIHPPVL